VKNFTAFILIVSLFLLTCCEERVKSETAHRSVEITVFHAGSLSKPFKEMKKEFESEHPEVTVLLEASGSRASARKITDLKRNADVMASADEHVIRTLLMPEHADWVIRFVTNELVLIYTEKSKYYKDIAPANWHEILLRKDVNYGHSEPELDPCGYRTLFVWQLAENYYGKKGLFNELDKNRPLKNIRPKETDLLSLLEFGELDYVFIYKSVAVQHGYKYIEFPEEINLGTVAHSDFYRSAKVKLKGKTPGDFIEISGEPIVYGITVPKNGLQQEWGEKFVEFIISNRGRKIMSDNGHPVIEPAQSINFDILPEKLKKLSSEI
jgi:molybdate/tungstate transport system substrate-binding protein